MSRTLAARAPAKLNLALSVGPRQSNGLHPICSWMVTVDLFDDLLLTKLDPGRLSRYAILWHAEAKRRSDINWSISKELTVLAHHALEKHAGRALPVQMKLEKRIPVGSGLGGGSSDAAAMLRATNELFELGLSLDELESIGSTIGSDVPFLVQGGSAIVQGYGEQITRHEHHRPIHAVIAFPDATCPTASVYNLFDESPGAERRCQRVMELAESARTLLPESLFNDLSHAAIQIAPRLQNDLAELSVLAQRPAHITGSGSSIFVVCDDQMHAIALADAVQTKLGLPCVSVQSIPRLSQPLAA